MNELSSFWAGAVRFAVGMDLAAAADAVGGFDVLEAGGEELLVAVGVPPQRARAWLATPPARTSGTPICRADPRYPAALAAVAEAPPVLFVEGDPAVLGRRSWAVVGTRRCSAYGAAVARHLAGRLAAHGLVVVSGLARGVDACAHLAALEVGATVAVLGHGLSFTSPPSNRGLRERIAGEGGALVTGFLDDQPPHPGTFPQRNAWISGLCEGVVVVEAGARSGARITARLAGEQGREVFAVPGPLGAPESVGCLELIADGAGVVVDVERFCAERAGVQPVGREAWLVALFAGETPERVARLAGCSTASLLARLSVMELEGRVVRLPGQRYAPGAGLVAG